RNQAHRVSPYSVRAAFAFAQEHPDARPLELPVLWSAVRAFRSDAGSCGAAFTWRRVYLGQPRRVLQAMQSSEGKSHAGRVKHASAATPALVLAACESADHALFGPCRRNVAQVSLLRS